MAENLNAAAMSVYPYTISDNEERSIVFTTYSPIDDNTIVHTTAHTTTPLAQLDHFDEWMAYMDNLGQLRSLMSTELEETAEVFVGRVEAVNV